MTRDGEALEAAKRFEQSLYNSDVESLTRSDMGFAYMSGIKWADENSKSPWISIKDDLPCNHSEMICGRENIDGTETIDVFCSNSYGHIWTDYMVYENGEWRWNDFQPDFWMLSPKLPR